MRSDLTDLELAEDTQSLRSPGSFSMARIAKVVAAALAIALLTSFIIVGIHYARRESPHPSPSVLMSAMGDITMFESTDASAERENGAACRLACLNGGTLQADCSCECPPGFEGSDCSQAVEANPVDQLNFLNSLLDKVELEDKRRAAAQPVLPSSVGYGRHPFTNRIALPVVIIEPSSNQIDVKGTKYSTPTNLAIDQSVAQPPKSSTKTWTNLRQYLEGLLDWNQVQTVVPSPLAENHRNYDELLTNLFSGGATVGQLRYTAPLYLVSAPSASVLTQFPLAPGVKHAFEFLTPHHFPARQDLYFALFDRIGVSVVWKSLNGGIIERTTRMRPDVWNLGGKVMTTNWIREQLTINWHEGQNVGQWTKSDPAFSKTVDFIRQVCRGGTSVEIDCMGVNLNAWANQLHRLPVPIQDSVVSLATLVTNNPTLKANLEKAIPAYLAREKAKYQKNP